MGHPIRNSKPLLARVRRIKGQADALERALQADTDCAAVLQQIAALRGAAAGLMAQVLEHRLRDHLGADGLSAQEREAESEALARTLRSYLK